MSEAFLTASEVADLLKLKVDTVYLLAQQGKLPGAKVGGQWRFMESRVIQWFESQTLSPSQNASRPFIEDSDAPPARSAVEVDSVQVRNSG